jgi:hypothetical protein
MPGRPPAWINNFVPEKVLYVKTLLLATDKWMTYKKWMTKAIRWEPDLILEVVRLTDCYPTDEVKVIATDEQVADIRKRYNLPDWLYDMLIEWSGHAFGGDGCLDEMRRRSEDEARPLVERALADYAAAIAENWLAACKYAREHGEAVTRPE